MCDSFATAAHIQTHTHTVYLPLRCVRSYMGEMCVCTYISPGDSICTCVWHWRLIVWVCVYMCALVSTCLCFLMYYVHVCVFVCVEVFSFHEFNWSTPTHTLLYIYIIYVLIYMQYCNSKGIPLCINNILYIYICLIKNVHVCTIEV